MAELWQRDPGTSRRAERLVLGEPEVAALLKRHLDGAGLPLSVIHVRLRQSEIAVQGRLALGALLEGEAVSPLGSLIPRRSLDAPVWITLWGTISLGPSANPRRASHAEATLTASQIGRLPMPACALTVLAGPRGAALLRWPVPLAVTGLEVGDGKLTIRAR